MLVAELREHVGFALKSADRLLLGLDTGERIDHFRQRTFARSQAQILGQVDQFHATAAECFDDAITAANYGVRSNHFAIDPACAATDPARLRVVAALIPWIEQLQHALIYLYYLCHFLWL
jgi:hypothetical protein